MSPEQASITRLYTAFAALDAGGMSACYAPDARFEDEVFKLNGQAQISAMWHMLCEATREKGSDVWRLEFRDVQGAERRGSAHWDAYYRFSATGRLVQNRIDAVFEFDADARILSQRDSFDFWAWSRQALGAPGYVLGWSSALQRKVQAGAASNLARYLERRTG
jgi:hypothetical protein